MAEIKSTLELVLERAAAMGKASKEDMEAEELVKEGMRLGGEYIRTGKGTLEELLSQVPPSRLPQVRKGVLATLLRNIILPKNEEQQTLAEKAIQGVMQLSGQATDLTALFKDLKQILIHYRQTKDQVYKRLEAEFSQQMEMMEQSVARQTGVKVRLDASQHPKFQEQWQKIQVDLNGQYGRALEQHKALLKQRLGG